MTARMASAKVEQSTKAFQDVAAKIGTIKSRELRTTKDYIDAYEEIDPLLVDFDARLQQFTDTLNEAQRRDNNRGPVNIQRFYGAHRASMTLGTPNINLSSRC